LQQILRGSPRCEPPLLCRLARMGSQHSSTETDEVGASHGSEDAAGVASGDRASGSLSTGPPLEGEVSSAPKPADGQQSAAPEQPSEGSCQESAGVKPSDGDCVASSDSKPGGGPLSAAPEQPSEGGSKESADGGCQTCRAATTEIGEPARNRNHGNLDYKAFLLESKGSVFDFYDKKGELGEGAFGDVWLARERIRASTEQEHGGRQVAVKRVRKPNSEVGLDEEEADSEEAIVDFRMEVDLMKSLDHPSICRLLEVFEDAKNIFLVMEHIQGGELFDRIEASGTFSEHDAALVVRQIASALAYCHQHGVVHRDIKPENILVVDPEPDDSDEEAGPPGITVKVIDFGFGCRILRGAKLKPKVGTFLYTAPEALKGDDCDEKIDLWALGCVLYVLLSGNSPFFGTSVRENITKGVFDFSGEEWAEVSDGAKDLIKGLLVVDPKTRMSASDVHNHPWVSIQTPTSPPNRRALLKTMKSMQVARKQTCLRHLCTGVLARQLDESALHELHETFERLDQDDNGILSITELKHIWADTSVECPAEIEQLFADLDMDGSGEIDYTEFIAACLDQKVQNQEEACWAAFRVFDSNGDGKVSFEELHSVVKGADMHGAFPQETLQHLWQELTGQELTSEPPDMKGEVDFDHFLAALGNAEALMARKSTGVETVGEEQQATETGSGGRRRSSGGSGLGGLPIAGRQRGRHSVALPIAGRKHLEEATASIATAPSDGGGLPIIGRKRPAVGGGGLPIKSRGGVDSASQGVSGGLPIASRASNH